MTEELERLLSELEIEQLIEIARRFDIDVSECDLKEEYIISISDSQNVNAEEVKSMFDKDETTEPRKVDDATASFSEAVSLLQETKARFENGDFLASIDKATEVMDAGAKALNAFYGKGLSYAIRSSESMILNLKKMNIDSTQVEQILENAKKTFENKEFDSAGNIVIQLRDAVADLVEQHSKKISEEIEATQVLIDEVKTLGADVSAAERKLSEARQLQVSNAHSGALESTKEAEALAKAARENKVADISDTITRAGELIEDARFLHAPTSEAEGFLESAKLAFEVNDFQSALENAGKASEAANKARDEQIQRALKLQEKLKVEGTGSVQPSVEAVSEPTVVSEPEQELTSEVEEKPEVAGETEPEETSKICPKCEGDPTYVEQYERYYCYTCSEYIEPVERETQEVALEEEVTEEQAVEELPSEEHVEAATETEYEEAEKACPKCGGEPTFVDQYQKFYCYTCSEYVEPEEKRIEEIAGAEEPVEEKIEAPETDTEAETEDVKPEEGDKVCPKCEGEPSYVEQYERYYCYTCSEYVEPVEKETGEVEPEEKSVEEKAEAPEAAAAPVESKPEEAKPEEGGKVCPKCEGEPTWVEQYERFYCYSCSEYVDPVEKKTEETAEEQPIEEKTEVPETAAETKADEAKPDTGGKVCPKCEGEPTWVEQYERYYCYACNEYVEPKEKTTQDNSAKEAKECPTCGKEATFVEDYKRYYCYTCSNYL